MSLIWNVLALIAFTPSSPAGAWNPEAPAALVELYRARDVLQDRLRNEPGVESVEVSHRAFTEGLIVTTADYRTERRLLVEYPHGGRVDEVPVTIECKHRLTEYYVRLKGRVRDDARGFTSLGLRQPENEPAYIEVGFGSDEDKRAFEEKYPPGSSIGGVPVVTLATGRTYFRPARPLLERLLSRVKRRLGIDDPGAARNAARDLQRLLEPEIPSTAVDVGRHEGRACLLVVVNDKEDALALARNLPADQRFDGFEVRMTNLLPGCSFRMEN